MVGDLVVTSLGVTHTVTPEVIPTDLTASLVAKVVLAGVIFGMVARGFMASTHLVRHLYERFGTWPPLRPFIGGVAIVGLTYLVGNRDYNGLSLPLITASLAGGAGVMAFAFAWKLVFTSVTLGSGFQGGEVTPLFVIGATLGAVLAGVLGVDPTLLAALGFVAVFAGAANVPITCTIMGAELFSANTMVLFALVCVVAYLCSPNRGIYSAQRVAIAKATPTGSTRTTEASGD
jgi:H+/Cl- antiporter ClcA